jgi:hypothetical protein
LARSKAKINHIRSEKQVKCQMKEKKKIRQHNLKLAAPAHIPVSKTHKHGYALFV